MNVTQPRHIIGLLLLFSILFFGSIVLPVAAQDTVRPEIYGWGIDGDIGNSPTFTVWANVTDGDSGIENVTVTIRQDGGERIVTLMSFNSTFYTVTLPHVELNHTYIIWVESYDVAGNLAVSFNRNFDLRINLDTTLDPSITLPYVVSVSFIALALAIGLSYEYNKRNPKPEMIPDEEESMETDTSE